MGCSRFRQSRHLLTLVQILVLAQIQKEREARLTSEELLQAKLSRTERILVEYQTGSQGKVMA